MIVGALYTVPIYLSETRSFRGVDNTMPSIAAFIQSLLSEDMYATGMIEKMDERYDDSVIFVICIVRYGTTVVRPRYRYINRRNYWYGGTAIHVLPMILSTLSSNDTSTLSRVYTVCYAWNLHIRNNNNTITVVAGPLLYRPGFPWLIRRIASSLQFVNATTTKLNEYRTVIVPIATEVSQK